MYELLKIGGIDMANRNEYIVVAKYSDGPEITAYHLQNIKDGSSQRFSRYQTIFLIGRGQIRNCSAQLYKDGVIIRGEGINLTALKTLPDPLAITSNGEAEIQNGTKPGEGFFKTPPILTLTAVIKNGKLVVGYLVKNEKTGKEIPVDRKKVLEYAYKKLVSNAWAQKDNKNNTFILRGLNCNLSDLTVLDFEEFKSKGKNTEPAVNEKIKYAEAPQEFVRLFIDKVKKKADQGFETALEIIDSISTAKLGEEINIADAKIVWDFKTKTNEFRCRLLIDFFKKHGQLWVEEETEEFNDLKYIDLKIPRLLTKLINMQMGKVKDGNISNKTEVENVTDSTEINKTAKEVGKVLILDLIKAAQNDNSAANDILKSIKEAKKGKGVSVKDGTIAIRFNLESNGKQGAFSINLNTDETKVTVANTEYKSSAENLIDDVLAAVANESGNN